MKKINSLNSEISTDVQLNLDSMIYELVERVEFNCVGNSCGLDDVIYNGVCTADNISFSELFGRLGR